MVKVYQSKSVRLYSIRHNYEYHYNHCRQQGRQRLLNACVSMWTESHKICKTGTLINHALPVFLFLLIMIKQVKSSSQICQYQRVNQYQLIDINASILSNRSVDFNPIIFYFLIIHHYSIFSTHVKRVLLFK